MKPTMGTQRNIQPMGRRTFSMAILSLLGGVAAAEATPPDTPLADDFERELRSALAFVKSRKAPYRPDTVASKVKLRVAAEEKNVATVFLLWPEQKDFLELMWWASFRSRLCRMAILVAFASEGDQDHSTAPGFRSMCVLFNAEQMRARREEVEIVNTHLKEWTRLAMEIRTALEQISRNG